MIEGCTVLAVIPARGGSKGIPGKNIRMLCGKPLIAWTIEAAHQSQYIDRIILSSDDDEIIRISQSYGCEVPFVRPRELAEDHCSTAEVVLHALQAIRGYAYVVVLQPTSPLRTSEDIDACIFHCIMNNANSCVSVSEVESSPLWMYELDRNGCMSPIMKQKAAYYQRQNLPQFYQLNGAIYVVRSEWFQQHKVFITENTLGHIMCREHSADIDEESDFRYVEWIWQEMSDREI